MKEVIKLLLDSSVAIVEELMDSKDLLAEMVIVALIVLCTAVLVWLAVTSYKNWRYQRYGAYPPATLLERIWYRYIMRAIMFPIDVVCWIGKGIWWLVNQVF